MRGKNPETWNTDQAVKLIFKFYGIVFDLTLSETQRQVYICLSKTSFPF